MDWKRIQKLWRIAVDGIILLNIIFFWIEFFNSIIFHLISDHQQGSLLYKTERRRRRLNYWVLYRQTQKYFSPVDYFGPVGSRILNICGYCNRFLCLFVCFFLFFLARRRSSLFMAHKDEESLIEWELFLFKCAAQGLSDRKPLDKNRHCIKISAEYIKKHSHVRCGSVFTAGNLRSLWLTCSVKGLIFYLLCCVDQVLNIWWGLFFEALCNPL